MSQQEWWDREEYKGTPWYGEDTWKVRAIVAEATRRGIEQGKREAFQDMFAEIKKIKNTEVRSVTMSSGKCDHVQQLTSTHRGACEDMEDWINDQMANRFTDSSKEKYEQIHSSM